MTMRDEIVQLERSGWKALSESSEAAVRFFADTLARDSVMLLPGGLLMADRERIIDSMGGVPWTSFELPQERVVELGDATAAVIYQGTARRGEQTYTALFNSTYVREDGLWKLAIHQQTPA